MPHRQACLGYAQVEITDNEKLVKGNLFEEG
jgi:hypothetical protein